MIKKVENILHVEKLIAKFANKFKRQALPTMRGKTNSQLYDNEKKENKRK